MLEKSIRTEIMVEELKSRGFVVVKKAERSGVAELLATLLEYDGQFSVEYLANVFEINSGGVNIIKNKAVSEVQILHKSSLVGLLEVICEYSFTKIEPSECGKFVIIRCRNDIERF